jgi:hypothetical protein
MRHGSWNPSAPDTKPCAAIRRPAANLGAEFNNFLFAIAAETDGGTVSVLSALARLDLDPWGEAAKLARLPKELAAHRLAGLIAPCASGTAPAQARRTAAKLVALLPSGFTLPAPQAPAGVPAAQGPAIAHARSILSFLLIFVVAMLGIQCVARIAAEPRNPTQIIAPPAASPPPAQPGHIER